MEAPYPTPHNIFICLPELCDDHHSHTNYPSGFLLQLPSLRVSGPVSDNCWHRRLCIFQVIDIKTALVYCLSYTYTAKRDYIPRQVIFAICNSVSCLYPIQKFLGRHAVWSSNAQPPMHICQVCQ